MNQQTDATDDIEQPGHRDADTSTESDLDVRTHAAADAAAQASDALQEAGEDTEPLQRTGKLASGFDAAEAARIRWSKHRAREAAEAAVPELDDATDLIVRVPIGRKAILTELEKRAAKGDTAASRELRAWLTELPIEDDTDVSTLDRRTRQALMAELLVRVRDESEDGLSRPATTT